MKGHIRDFQVMDSGLITLAIVVLQTALNKAAAEAMLISASILRLGTSKAVAHGIDDDSRDRIVSSLKVFAVRHCGLLDCCTSCRCRRCSVKPAAAKPGTETCSMTIQPAIVTLTL